MVIGIGRRQATLRTARRVGAVTNTTVDLANGVTDAELIVGKLLPYWIIGMLDVTLAVMATGIGHIVGEGARAPAGVHLLPKSAWEKAL